MSRKYSTSNNYKAFAALLMGIAKIGANLQNKYANMYYASEQDRLKQENLRLKNENLRLKNQHEQFRMVNSYDNNGVIKNRVVELDQKIDLNELRIRRERWNQDNAGITAPKFTASDYPEPGDVRRKGEKP